MRRRGTAALTSAETLSELRRTPLRYHAVMMALSKAGSALAMLDDIDRPCDDDEWSRDICLDALKVCIEDARRAYSLLVPLMGNVERCQICPLPANGGTAANEGAA